jgi:integrase
MEFDFQDDVKQEYLNSKPLSTASSSIYVLRKVAEYEAIKNKPIYDMTPSELNDLIASKFYNPSLRSIKKNASIMRRYIEFCRDIKHLFLHNDNRLEFWTAENLSKFVSKNIVRSRYISPKELREYEELLVNPQDKLFLRLPYLGIKGRTTKGNTCEEIVNLRISDVNKDNNTIKVWKNNGESRVIFVDTNTVDLIQEVYDEKTYTENNGEMPENARNKTPKKRVVNHVEDYVLRIPSKDKFSKFNGQIINSRMVRIQNFVGNQFLTINNLYFSGMITMALQIYKDKGQLTKADYLNICSKFDYGNGNPLKYWFNLKEIVEQYI